MRVIDKDAASKQIMPHLASIVNPALKKEKSIANMENLPGVITTADSARSGRLKVDTQGMRKKHKKIMKEAVNRACK